VEYLEAYKAANCEKPFFLQCSFTDPHHPFTPPGEYFDLYKPEDVELPRSFYQPLEDATPQVRHVRELLLRGERDIDVGFAYAVTEAEARQAIALTYGMIALIDDAVGRVLACLERLGLSENTVVVFTSDHGDFMGDHQLLLKGPLHYRGVVNVPFIWKDPASRTGSTCERLACSLDFVPTVLARAGLQPFHGIQGKNLLGLLSGDDAPLHSSVLVEEENQRNLFGRNAPPRARTLITEDCRISIYDETSWGELYDLGQDPEEMKNLWDDPASAGLKSTMLEQLARKMLELGDRSPFPTMRA
jgi:arylsulfatase A-like enzyme